MTHHPAQKAGLKSTKSPELKTRSRRARQKHPHEKRPCQDTTAVFEGGIRFFCRQGEQIPCGKPVGWMLVCGQSGVEFPVCWSACFCTSAAMMGVKSRSGGCLQRPQCSGEPTLAAGLAAVVRADVRQADKKSVAKPTEMASCFRPIDRQLHDAGCGKPHSRQRIDQVRCRVGRGPRAARMASQS